jgi:hypothetical protein
MSTVVERYDYTDETGALLYQVERLDPKGFRVRRPDGNGGWTWNIEGVRRVPYRLPELITAVKRGERIDIHEGEKDANTLAQKGKNTTTVPGGAGKWLPEYAEFFRGAKVAIFTHNDDKGRRHALAVACALDSIAEVKIFQPDPRFNDITEHLEGGLTLKQVIPFERTEWSKKLKIKPPPTTGIRIVSMAELRATPDPDEHDFLWGPGLMRKARMIVAAYTGYGKTTWSMWLLKSILAQTEFLNWTGQGNGSRALVLDVEQGRWTIKHRFKEVGLLDMDSKVDLIPVPDGLSLDANEHQCDDIEGILKAGHYDVVLADPFYKLHATSMNDETRALNLMRRFDAWRDDYGFAMVIPMHCRKPLPGMKWSMNDISGSATLTHGADIILGLERTAKNYSRLHWWKDREGYTGALLETWGMHFYPDSGFTRDKRDLEEHPLWTRVRSELERKPGQTIAELMTACEAKQTQIRRALESVGATFTGPVKPVDKRRYEMPPSFFTEDNVIDLSQHRSE